MNEGALEQVLLRLWGRSPKQADLERIGQNIESGLTAKAFLRQMAGSKPFLANRQVRCHNPAGHFYSPVVDPDEVRDYYAMSSLAEELPGIELPIETMIQFWRASADFIRSCPFSDRAGENRYGYTEGPFNYGDGITLRAMIGYFRPKRIIEIGSGSSSACILDSAEHAALTEFSLTCIEPYPTRLKRMIRPTDSVAIHERGVQGFPLEMFSALEENDILFIDSSHVLKTGSDVHYELFYILPVLRSGVLVHFHDCRFPLEYSEKQVIEKNYSWNEVYAVRALLMWSTRFKIFFWGSYFAKQRPDLVGAVSNEFLKNPGASLWLRVH
jgi:predicted O-methyltransferase YrrM